MESSTLIAQLLSLVYIIIGLGILADTTRYRSLFESMLGNQVFLFLAGILSLVIGFVIVKFHNTWQADWSVLITVIGWIALVKGVLLIVSPDALLKQAHYWLEHLQLVALVTIVLGLALGYMGFVA
ncbi:hypothetical protein COU76_04630 [Candidatus Peregrinibacteria bacterium CG10_big_fil_rev_8_21_14_0_10_49_10]|nr:MAG: hypothetical protein COU76_04630 [Candidatus Peregrinibacteria bacterium CG10_big_fil_rev_8_21_14_0_10_49_10]